MERIFPPTANAEQAAPPNLGAEDNKIYEFLDERVWDRYFEVRRD